MSTNARIGLLMDDDIVLSVYLHFDGYPDHTGEILYHHYNTIDKIEELLCYGDISSLGETIQTTTFFSRDKKENEEDVLAKVQYIDIFESYIDKHYVSYLYLFKDGKWLVKGDLDG